MYRPLQEKLFGQSEAIPTPIKQQMNCWVILNTGYKKLAYKLKGITHEANIIATAFMSISII